MTDVVKTHPGPCADLRRESGLADVNILIRLVVIFLVPVVITSRFLLQKQRDDMKAAERGVVVAEYVVALRGAMLALGRERGGGAKPGESRAAIGAAQAVGSPRADLPGGSEGRGLVKAAWARPEKGPGGTATEQARAGFAGLGTALPSQILDEAAGNTLSRHPLEHREVLEGRITASADFHWCMPGLTATCILATRVGFVLLGRQLVRTTRGRELAGKRAEDENQRKENANVRLMNEMGALADGDLTTKATVSEGITGAIADSVNLTMGELRKVGDSVELMSQSIGAVSKSAGVAAAVARQSLMTAERGSLAVQNSVNSMNHIRDRIQETSKRIKRLGGSTQEIGEIVGLISGITEQHNVLALNAAIQAGTQDAVAAMERSTHGVVKGTQRSDAAGSALSEIDTVTNELAERIQNIAVSTKMQVDIALKAAKSMHNSLTFTREATMGTNETAATIRQLAARARQLKPSVSRFQV